MRRTQIDNFNFLPPEGRELILGWFRRAWDLRHCRDELSFEPFIFCWIAFNSWATCVTSGETDAEIIKMLIGDDGLRNGFGAFVEADPEFRELVHSFRLYWPVFNVQELRRRRIPSPYGLSREEAAVHYFDQGAIKYKPMDPENPRLLGAEFPTTFGNVLDTIYRVRCNLFHGDKRLTSGMDQQITGAAFRVLVHFFERVLSEPDYFQQRRQPTVRMER